jgi:hypothetical protein
VAQVTDESLAWSGNLTTLVRGLDHEPVADAHQTTSGNPQPGVRRAQHDAPAGEGAGGADGGAAQRRAGEQGEHCSYVRTARTGGGGADADRHGAPLAASASSPQGATVGRHGGVARTRFG